MNSNNNGKNRYKIAFFLPGFFNLSEYQKLFYYPDFPYALLSYISLLGEKNLITEPLLIDVRREEEINPHGYNCTEHDLSAFKDFFLKVCDKWGVVEYEIAAISCYTSFQYIQTVLMANILKQINPKIKIVVGGYHPTSIPEDFDYPNSPFDFIIRGEGEKFFLDFLKNGNIIKNQKTKIITPGIIEDINLFPFPNYEIYLQTYPHSVSKLNYSLLLSRGCTNQCTFCAKNFKYRLLSRENATSQIDKMVEIAQNNEVQKISFGDQAFVHLDDNKDWLFDHIVKKGYNENMEFSGQARIDSTTDHSLKRFQEVNMTIGYGLESASESMLVNMRKTTSEGVQNYLKRTLEIIKYYEKHGRRKAKCRLNIIVGYPGETKETLAKTAEFVESSAESESIYVSPSIFMLYPNAYVYQNITEFIDQFGIKFTEDYWKDVNGNPLKVSSIDPSKNYLKRQMIPDYIQTYHPVITASEKLDIISKMQNKRWLNFFKQWSEELESGTITDLEYFQVN